MRRYAKTGPLVPTGIKLKATVISTGKATTSGFQLDNGRMEIMAAPDIKVEVIGFSEMYEEIKANREWLEKFVMRFYLRAENPTYK